MSAILAIAPMVKQSDFGFRSFVQDETLPHLPPSGRLLSYSPMLVAHNVLSDDAYIARHLYSRSDERDLVVQLAGSSADELRRAAHVVMRQQPHVAALDVNLGCPQPDAAAQCYGAFMALDVSLTQHCVSALVESLSNDFRRPVFAKVRCPRLVCADSAQCDERTDSHQ